MTLPFCQLRILVAESDNATRRLMAQTLEKMGAAGNGRLCRHRSHPPH
jgi:hypothetical protein